MVLPAFLKSDREAALAWIENLTNPAARATARREVALAEATGGITHGHQPPPPPPGQAPQSATASIASTPEALADHLKSYPEALHGKIVSRFVQDQYATNPKEAAALILSLPKGPHQGQALETFMMRGTEDDPATAAELFNHLPPSPKYLRWIEQISRSFVKADPKAAFEWAQELPREGYRREALKQVTPELTRTLDPTDILTQLQSLPQDHAQEAATSTLLEAWSNLDLKEATTTALDLGHHRVLRGMFTYGRKPTDEVIDAHQAVMEAANVPQEDQLSIATTLAKQFAASDAEGSLECSQSLPQGAIQQTALQTSISQWAQADAAAASRYVSEFDNAELKDHAAAGLVTGTVEIDQEASFRWALTISDESLRADAMTIVVRPWRGSDPEALRAALHSATSLSSQERTKWLEDLP